MGPVEDSHASPVSQLPNLLTLTTHACLCSLPQNLRGNKEFKEPFNYLIKDGINL